MNQDNFFIYSEGGFFKIFGVFDGHGPFGHKVSQYVSGKMLELIRSEQLLRPEYLAVDDNKSEIEEVLKKCFKLCQKGLKGMYNSHMKKIQQQKADEELRAKEKRDEDEAKIEEGNLHEKKQKDRKQ